MTRPMPQADKIAAVLAEGPSTTWEIAAELGWRPNLVAAHLGAMVRRGQVTREQMSANKRRLLWSLAGRGGSHG